MMHGPMNVKSCTMLHSPYSASVCEKEARHDTNCSCEESYGWAAEHGGMQVPNKQWTVLNFVNSVGCL
jgi:hypothetical protein